MCEAVGWLDSHSGSAAALATLVLVSVTVWYAVSTAQMVAEMRTQAQILATHALTQLYFQRAQLVQSKVDAAKSRAPLQEDMYRVLERQSALAPLEAQVLDDQRKAELLMGRILGMIEAPDLAAASEPEMRPRPERTG